MSEQFDLASYVARKRWRPCSGHGSTRANQGDRVRVPWPVEACSGPSGGMGWKEGILSGGTLVLDDGGRLPYVRAGSEVLR